MVFLRIQLHFSRMFRRQLTRTLAEYKLRHGVAETSLDAEIEPGMALG
jgi:hypothetical protein